MLTETSMKATGLMTWPTAMAPLFMLRAANTEENGMRILGMEKAKRYYLMVPNTKEITNMARKMAKEH